MWSSGQFGVDAGRVATVLSNLKAGSAASYVRHMRFRDGTELLTRLGAMSPERLRDVVQALPPRLAASMISQQSDGQPELRDQQRKILP